MYPTYDKQRKYLHDRAQANVATAAAQAARIMENEIKWQQEKTQYLTQITEDYIKTGYYFTSNLSNKHNWHSAGEFKYGSSYLKALAKDMKRPFIWVQEVGMRQYPWIYNHRTIGSDKHTYTTRFVVQMPNLVRLAPLYAHLEIISKSAEGFYSQGNECRSEILKYEYKSIRKYEFIHKIEVGENDIDPPSLEQRWHPLALDWVQRMETDPQWRVLLKIPNL